MRSPKSDVCGLCAGTVARAAEAESAGAPLPPPPPPLPLLGEPRPYCTATVNRPALASTDPPLAVAAPNAAAPDAGTAAEPNAEPAVVTTPEPAAEPAARTGTTASSREHGSTDAEELGAAPLPSMPACSASAPSHNVVLNGEFASLSIRIHPHLLVDPSKRATVPQATSTKD